VVYCQLLQQCRPSIYHCTFLHNHIFDEWFLHIVYWRLCRRREVYLGQTGSLSNIVRCLTNERSHYSVTGVTIVSLQDSDAENIGPRSGSIVLLGDAIALLGAGFYGCYTTLVKLRIHHESRVDMPLFFGFVGLFCFLFLWPFIFILSAIGVEPFELPPSHSVTICILVNRWSVR